MNGAAMASFRAAGAFCDEYDPDEPERRTRCTCGAFLKTQPTFEGGVFPVTRDYGSENPETGEWLPHLVEDEEVYEPSTDCKKCGRIWEESELWR